MTIHGRESFKKIKSLNHVIFRHVEARKDYMRKLAIVIKLLLNYTVNIINLRYIMIDQHCRKYARIRVFTDPHSPV